MNDQKIPTLNPAVCGSIRGGVSNWEFPVSKRGCVNIVFPNK